MNVSNLHYEILPPTKYACPLPPIDPLFVAWHASPQMVSPANEETDDDEVEEEEDEDDEE